jgi:hypothetical protein
VRVHLIDFIGLEKTNIFVTNQPELLG